MYDVIHHTLKNEVLTKNQFLLKKCIVRTRIHKHLMEMMEGKNEIST